MRQAMPDDMFDRVPNSVAKLVKSLQLKKYRKQEQCFLLEGKKSILELLETDYKIKFIIGSEGFLQNLQKFLNRDREKIFRCSPAELSAMSSLKTNEQGIAVVEMKEEQNTASLEDSYVLGLDGINDPGNLGTLIRIADWYGIKHILCSENCVDQYNPKVIQASMGSFLRVNIINANLKSFLYHYSQPIIGTFLEGENVHSFPFPKGGGMILLGSESHGISEELLAHITHKISIPKFGNAESLNVAVAGGIILDNLFR